MATEAKYLLNCIDHSCSVCSARALIAVSVMEFAESAIARDHAKRLRKKEKRKKKRMSLAKMRTTQNKSTSLGSAEICDSR